jgi:hypothetical protein
MKEAEGKMETGLSGVERIGQLWRRGRTWEGSGRAEARQVEQGRRTWSGSTARREPMAAHGASLRHFLG